MVGSGALEYEGHAINRNVVMDYGLIVRASNPFTSRDRTAILFAGSHTYGTIAAAKFFTEDLHKYLRKLTSNIGSTPFRFSFYRLIVDHKPLFILSQLFSEFGFGARDSGKVCFLDQNASLKRTKCATKW